MDWNVLIFFFFWENIISFWGFLLTLNLQWIFSFLLLFLKKKFHVLQCCYGCIVAFQDLIPMFAR